jgi:hypothetical protein
MYQCTYTLNHTLSHTLNHTLNHTRLAFLHTILYYKHMIAGLVYVHTCYLAAVLCILSCTYLVYTILYILPTYTTKLGQLSQQVLLYVS